MDELVQKGYDCFDGEEPEQGLAFRKDAWTVFLTAIDQISETYSVGGLLDEQDYLYPIDSCFQCGIGESLFRQGKATEAYEMIRKVTWGVSCYMDNEMLFMRAKQLADYLVKKMRTDGTAAVGQIR